MTFSILRKTACFIVFILAAGCAGESTSSFETKSTFLSKSQVVAGLVYGYGNKTIAAVGAVSGQNSLSAAYKSTDSGQYAFTNYPPEHSPDGDIFSAVFTDGTVLYSVWSGRATPSADVTEISTHLSASSPTNVTVSPDNFEARANISPLTDLAYRYWLYDKQKSPYSDYLTSVFWFFNGMFFLPEQNAVHDYPSSELLTLLNRIEIRIATDAAGFSLIDRAKGTTLCRATFAQFPICN